MTYVITSECVSCGVCIEMCPVSAIIDGEERFVITSACLDCGKCAEACPIDAIRRSSNGKKNGITNGF